MPTSASHLLSHAETRLAHAGCEAPQGDAYLLLAHAMGISPETLLSNPAVIVPDDAVDRFQVAVGRREKREPTQYITGSCAFRGLRLAIDERVLVPRIESELLVEAGVRLPHAARLVDVGTGSGALALAVKNERPDLSVTATDISESALEVAEANGARLDIDVSWRQADLLAGLPDVFDAVLANMPYYPCDLPAPLAPELMDYEPSLAIFTASDGLALTSALVGQIAARSEVQMVALEIAIGQGDAVTKLLSDAGFASVERRTDLTGNERTVIATKNGR
jgi:release factor glutamine methyltransferase